MDNFWLYFSVVCGVICITCFVADAIIKVRNKKKSLSEAVAKFGDYTDSFWIASRDKHVLYNINTHKILLNYNIYNTDSIKGYKTDHISAVTKVTYNEQTVTRTNPGSVLARGVAGAIIAGPVGAAVGASTAEKITETKKTPVSYNYLRAEKYIIDIIDKKGKVATSLITEKYNEFRALISFLDPIIERLY